MWILVAPMWVLVTVFYGFLVLGLFCFAANLCMNTGNLIMNEFQFGKEKKHTGPSFGHNRQETYWFMFQPIYRKSNSDRSDQTRLSKSVYIGKKHNKSANKIIKN